jgi:hypothetical protein
MSDKLTFNQCTLPFLDKVFGLRMVRELPALKHWLQQSQESAVSDLDRLRLADLQDLFLNNAYNWNEQELSLPFIGPIFSIVKFGEPYRYNLFAERYIETKVQDYILADEPDELIASGYHDPDIPYFAFAKYKRQRDPHGDPAGQVLAAMLVGQTLNTNQSPVYGAYVVGREWYFMVLETKQYAISQGHNALQRDDLIDIFRILKALKTIISTLIPRTN